MYEILRHEFLSDWLETATKEEIIEKLIQNDERAKKLKKIEEYVRNIVDDDLYKMNCCYDVNGTEIRKELEELLKWVVFLIGTMNWWEILMKS